MENQNLGKVYLIGEVSRRVGLSQKRIREYEKEGLIAPSRDGKTNNRIYSDYNIAQIQHVKNLIHKHGFTISCLKTLLLFAPCWKIFNCQTNEDCAAFKNPDKPCYEIMKKEYDSGCKNCPIYLNRNQKPVNILIKD